MNIPDTADVKETFGSVINTVVEQQDEIQVLHSNVDSNATESVEGQRKLLAWTASCVRKLKAENARLQTKLGDANKQLKNLSYNMQGFIDQEAANDAEAEEDPIEFDDMPKLHGPKSADAEHCSLFPTEEGADMSHGGMSFVAPEIRKFAKYKDPEAKQRAKEYYESIPANRMPKNAKARWRWAFKKVINNERRKHLKVGFTRSRMEPKQTYAGRLDRVEAVMFEMKADFKNQLADMNKKTNHKIDTTVARLDREVSKAAEKVDELTQDVKNRFEDAKEEIAMVDASLKDFMAKVNQQAAGDTKHMKESLKVVEAHLKDLVHLELESLRSHVNHITTELDQFEGAADSLLQRVEAQHALSASIAPYDPAKPMDETVSELTDLLHADTTLREARSELALLEAGIATIFRLYQNVSQQVNSVSHHYAKESVQTAAVEMISASQLEDLTELGQRCIGVDGHIKHISSLFASLDRMCLEHDKILKGHVKVFNNMSKDVRWLAAANTQVNALIEELKNKVASGAGSSAGSAGLNGRQMEVLLKLASDVTDLTKRVGAVELASVDLDFEEGSFGEPEPEAETGFEPEDEGPVIVPVFEPVVPSKSVKMVLPEEHVPAEATSAVVTDSLYEKITVALDENAAPVTESVKVRTSEPVQEETDSPAAETPARVTIAAEPAPARPTPVLSHAATVSALSTAPAPAITPKSKQRVSAAGVAGGSEKRKASSAANLEVLEARLRPLIERLVAAGIEEKMAAMDQFEEDEEEEDFGDEQADGFDEELPSREPSPSHAQVAVDPAAVAPAAVVPAVSNAVPGAEATAVAAAPAAAPSEPLAIQPVQPAVPDMQRGPSIMMQRGNSMIPSPGSDGSATGASPTRQKYQRQGSIEGIPPPRDPRIRREASRFGMMESSGKMRGGSSKSNKMRGMDLSPYIEELAQLKKENSRLTKGLRQMEEERLTKDDVERMVTHLIHAQHHNEQKEESNHAIHSMERRLDTLTKEISTLRSNNLKAISALQAEFSETLYKVVNTAAESLDADNKESFVSTRALCLGCGRNSLVRAQPESRPTSPSFFPHISAGNLPGPDILRGGFKMPVKNPLNPLYVLEGAASPGVGKTRAVKSAGQRMQESLLSTSLDGGQGSTTSIVAGSSIELDTVLPRVKSAQPRPYSHHVPREGGEMEDDDHEEEEVREEQHGVTMNITGGALEDASRVTMGGDGSMIIQANKGYQLNIASSKSTSTYQPIACKGCLSYCTFSYLHRSRASNFSNEGGARLRTAGS